MVLPSLLWMACGQVYRPVVIPCSSPGVPGCPPEPAPTPASFHAVFGISTNVPNSPGGAIQIDVSGDSIIAETPTSDQSAPNLGVNPTHAAVLPNNARLLIASAGSVQGGIDVVSSLAPAFQSTIATGFGPPNTINLPGQTSSITAISESGDLVTVTLSVPLNNVPAGYTVVIANVVIPNCSLNSQPPCNPNAYDGAFTVLSNNGTTITYSNPNPNLAAASGGSATFPPQPVFLNSTQSDAMFVANYNTNSVSAINTTSNVVSNTAPVGAHPVSLAEMPNGLKLYVANQGDNTISSLNVQTLTPNIVTIPAGITLTTPVWVMARGDCQKVYVLTQGSTQVEGQLVTIDTATDTVTSSLPVGAGANYMVLDPNLNRLYVTNPATSTVYVFSDTGGANDTPIQTAAISFASGSAPCPAGCSPTSVAVLPDGSRFYVASYQTAASCPDPFVGSSSACVIPGLTVFDANSLTLKYPNAPTLTLLTYPPFAANLAAGQYQYAVPPVSNCVSPVLPAVYAPGATRFRVFTTAAVDGSHVYVSMCDAGAVADINTADSNTNNTGGGGTPADALVTDLPAAYGVCAQTSCNSVALIAAFSITNNVVTFQAANTFVPGQQVVISGFTTGTSLNGSTTDTYLNGFTLTVLSAGLSSTQFECDFTHPNVALTSDSGSAISVPPLQTPIFLLTGQ
jgi:YVTN family beta-propeller protein